MCEVMTTDEAAQALGVHVRTLQRIARHAMVIVGATASRTMYDAAAIMELKHQRASDVCSICESQPKRAGRFRTCGSPRCTQIWREQRHKLSHAKRKQMREAGETQPLIKPAPATGVLEIMRAWQQTGTLNERERYIATAFATGASVATVISVVRSQTKAEQCGRGMRRLRS
jgi:hypothetical protein